LTALAAWTALTAQFAFVRILPGPRTRAEIARMIVTSIVIPPVAVFHRARGTYRESRAGRRVDAVLFDRDGTLVVDVPFNGDPERVEPVSGAAAAVGRLRAAALRTGVVSNQSAVALGLIGPEDVAAVNARVDELVGPIGGWWCCPHGDGDGCGCRKPAPGLVVTAARESSSRLARCVVIGDTGADVAAAKSAGARAVLVPNDRTRAEEIEDASVVAGDLHTAVDYVIDLVVGR
jgi:histidinol-phosphate phosphatase family protein